MATANISFNPALTSNVIGSFAASTGGFIQGAAQDDPTVRNLLQGGLLASTETIAMWGGVAIGTYIPTPGTSILGQTLPDSFAGPNVQRATTNAGITGFSVFNQTGNAVMAPGGGVPLLASGQKVSFYYTGSNARIPLQIDPALINQDGSLTSTQFSWDFVGQRLTSYQAAFAAASVQSATYTSATGVLAVTFASAPAGTTPTVGTFFTITGMTTSAGSASAVNGDFALVSSGSSGTILNFNVVAGLGTITINSGTGTLAAGGGAVPIKQIQQIKGTGCKVVTYNPVTGAITWSESGACALALI